VIGTLIAGLVLVASFVIWERRTDHPMLPLAMFRRRSFTPATGISFSLFAGLFGGLFLMSQFFQTAQGHTPLQAGAMLPVWSATGVFVAPTAGRLADRYGNRPLILIGLAMQTGSFVGLAIIAHRHTAFLALVPVLAINGSGTAMVFPTVANEVMASVAPEQIGIASGTNNARASSEACLASRCWPRCSTGPASTPRPRRSLRASDRRCGWPSRSRPSGSRSRCRSGQPRFSRPSRRLRSAESVNEQARRRARSRPGDRPGESEVRRRSGGCEAGDAGDAVAVEREYDESESSGAAALPWHG
jgi:hypothetical protein